MPETVAHTKTIFCAACQRDDEMTLTFAINRDGHSEAIAECHCGRFLKFALVEAADFERLLAEHRAANLGQVSVEKAAAIQEAQEQKFRAMIGAA